MAQNAIFKNCSNYIPTLKDAEWLHPANSGAKTLDEIFLKSGSAGGDQKIIKFDWPKGSIYSISNNGHLY